MHFLEERDWRVEFSLAWSVRPPGGTTVLSCKDEHPPTPRVFGPGTCSTPRSLGWGWEAWLLSLAEGVGGGGWTQRLLLQARAGCQGKGAQAGLCPEEQLS